MSPNKKYSIKEVSQILESATQIQKSKAKGNENGLSAQEILQIARDSGIDEQAIIHAIDNLGSQISENNYSWLRGTKEVSVGETINQEISDEDWTDVLKVVRRLSGPVNIIENAGPNYECDQMVDEITYSHLALTSKNGKSSIEYSTNWTSLKLILHFFLLLVPTIVGIVIGLKNDWVWRFVLGMGLAGTLTGFALARIGLKMIFESEKRKAKRLVTEIKSRILRNVEPQIEIEEESERSNEVQSTSSPKIRS